MKKKLSPEQAKVAKAIRVMLKIALRILEEQKSKASSLGENELKSVDKFFDT